jgi:hypothetical protein
MKNEKLTLSEFQYMLQDVVVGSLEEVAQTGVESEEFERYLYAYALLFSSGLEKIKKNYEKI